MDQEYILIKHHIYLKNFQQLHDILSIYFIDPLVPLIVSSNGRVISAVNHATKAAHISGNAVLEGLTSFRNFSISRKTLY